MEIMVLSNASEPAVCMGGGPRCAALWCAARCAPRCRRSVPACQHVSRSLLRRRTSLLRYVLCPSRGLVRRPGIEPSHLNSLCIQ